MPGQRSIPRLNEPHAITVLHDAIRDRHGLDSIYLLTEHVDLLFDESVRWDGLVRVFEVNHPETEYCYAWCYEKGDEIKFICILQIPPIDSAKSAVEAARAMGLGF